MGFLNVVNVTVVIGGDGMGIQNAVEPKRIKSNVSRGAGHYVQNTVNEIIQAKENK